MLDFLFCNSRCHYLLFDCLLLAPYFVSFFSFLDLTSGLLVERIQLRKRINRKRIGAPCCGVRFVTPVLLFYDILLGLPLWTSSPSLRRPCWASVSPFLRRSWFEITFVLRIVFFLYNNSLTPPVRAFRPFLWGTLSPWGALWALCSSLWRSRFLRRSVFFSFFPLSGMPCARAALGFAVGGRGHPR